MDRRVTRKLKNRIFTAICWVTASISVVLLGILLFSIARQGVSHLDWSFIKGVPSRSADKAGMWPAILGSILICATCALFALPIGVGTAIFLEEYKPRNRWVRKAHGFVQLNIANLAGVPSIVYGIIGLTVFVQFFSLLGNPNQPAYTIGVDWYDEFVDESGEYLRLPAKGHAADPVDLQSGITVINDDGERVEITVLTAEEISALHDHVEARVAQIPADLSTEEYDAREAAIREDLLGGVVTGDVYIQRTAVKKPWYAQIPVGRGVLAGGLTLMLVILPIVIISSQEAIRAVPSSLREAAFGLGATRWQTVRRTVLPAAIPGIMTGSILAMSRAIGEAAPILIIAGIVYITFTPRHLMDEFTAMPLQIYNWASLPQKDFHEVAASGIIVLLAVLLTFNAAAVFIRQKFTKPTQ